MTRLLLLFFFAAFLVGCSSDKERNINRDRDRPKRGANTSTGTTP